MNAKIISHSRGEPCRVATSEGSRGLQSTVLSRECSPSRSDEGTRAMFAVMAGDSRSCVATRHDISCDFDRGLKSTATFLGRYATDAAPLTNPFFHLATVASDF